FVNLLIPAGGRALRAHEFAGDRFAVLRVVDGPAFHTGGCGQRHGAEVVEQFAVAAQALRLQQRVHGSIALPLASVACHFAQNVRWDDATYRAADVAKPIRVVELFHVVFLWLTKQLCGGTLPLCLRGHKRNSSRLLSTRKAAKET